MKDVRGSNEGRHTTATGIASDTAATRLGERPWVPPERPREDGRQPASGPLRRTDGRRARTNGDAVGAPAVQATGRRLTHLARHRQTRSRQHTRCNRHDACRSGPDSPEPRRADLAEAARPRMAHVASPDRRGGQLRRIASRASKESPPSLSSAPPIRRPGREWTGIRATAADAASAGSPLLEPEAGGPRQRRYLPLIFITTSILIAGIDSTRPYDTHVKRGRWRHQDNPAIQLALPCCGQLVEGGRTRPYQRQGHRRGDQLAQRL